MSPCEADLPALCRRRRPETAERDLIGAWLLPRLRSVRSPVAPNLGGGDLDDRDRSGRAQAVADGGRRRRGWTDARRANGHRRERWAGGLGFEPQRRAAVGARGLP